MHTADVVYSDSLEQATARFLDDLQAWIDDCVERYRDAPPTDVHDQLTYTVAWRPLIQHRGHARALAFLKTQRDAVHRHFVDIGQWHHGYWKKQEVHHGTEHFELFMRTLWQIDPDDPTTVEQFIDAAEHVGKKLFPNGSMSQPACSDRHGWGPSRSAMNRVTKSTRPITCAALRFA
jgi:hypothetical protein